MAAIMGNLQIVKWRGADSVEMPWMAVATWLTTTRCCYHEPVPRCSHGPARQNARQLLVGVQHDETGKRRRGITVGLRSKRQPRQLIDV